jgi:hypothetical protein
MVQFLKACFAGLGLHRAQVFIDGGSAGAMSLEADATA